MTLVALVGVTASAQNPGGSPEGKKMVNPVKATPDSIEAGKTLYLRTCRGCHGESGKGDGPSAKALKAVPSDLTDAKWDRGSTDGEIFLVVRNGAGPNFDMRANKVLKDEDIWNIVNYVRSIGPKK
ncbi:MAG TPA: cytochrome c [Vicinamibacterales bacterium]|nr:cytochrome c [Vicinamibacterales bacterium]